MVHKYFVPLLNGGLDLMLCAHIHRYRYDKPGTLGADFPIVCNNKEERLDAEVTAKGIKINMFVSERADVRTCRYFPASAYAAGITLPEGRYDITVVFKTSSGGKVETLEYNGVSVSKSGLNLVESYCFK